MRRADQSHSQPAFLGRALQPAKALLAGLAFAVSAATPPTSQSDHAGGRPAPSPLWNFLTRRAPEAGATLSPTHSVPRGQGAPLTVGGARGCRLVPCQGGRGQPRAYKSSAAPPSRFAPAFPAASCGVACCPRAPPGFPRPSRVSRRSMAMKAVCVLKGDGPVQGTIHFEQKARPGAQAAVTRSRRT